MSDRARRMGCLITMALPEFGMNKVGRNDPCPCGSGKKYKKCHGLTDKSSINETALKIPEEEFKRKIAEIEGAQKQREQQQGLGKQIISTTHNGYRIVAIGSELHYSKKWKTFHDFLFYYIKKVTGEKWGTDEIKKPYEKRHPILQWYHLICQYQKENSNASEEIHTAPIIGVVEAYLRLAYNLYLLAHNVEIQSRLIKRLKDKSQFYGAYYETYVAGEFIKAGFDIELENEADNSTSHCEFTAICKKTGNKYSVEAKTRAPNKLTVEIGHQLYAALEKNAKHKRVIFIDINIPDKGSNQQNNNWWEETLKNLLEKEKTLTIKGNPAPEAYVFVTNYPYHYDLSTYNSRYIVFAEGFKIPEFKKGYTTISIKDALEVRKRHADMDQLFESIKSYHEIPSTFDGEIPEFVFDPSHENARLKIGQKYQINNKDGILIHGELIDAVVSKEEKIANCIYKTTDGKTVMIDHPLSDSELIAYLKYPDTFFGVYRPQSKNITDPLELYDFFYASYKKTPKERLLEFMKNHPDFEELKQKDQQELASIYCERAVYGAMNSLKKQPS